MSTVCGPDIYKVKTLMNILKENREKNVRLFTILTFNLNIFLLVANSLL
jgi:hypothetical protein